MSTQPDWSTAPEGATHWAPKREDNDMWCAVFWRLENGVGVEAWQVCNQTGRLTHIARPTWLPTDAPRLIPRPAAWTGEGLPPVGTVCEYKGARHYLAWSEVTIFAAWGDQVFVDYVDGWRAETDASRFRPIRTPEQIAAEEREKAIDEMVAQSPMLDKTWSRKVCQALYDAGYRKHDAQQLAEQRLRRLAEIERDLGNMKGGGATAETTVTIHKLQREKAEILSHYREPQA